MRLWACQALNFSLRFLAGFPINWSKNNHHGRTNISLKIRGLVSNNDSRSIGRNTRNRYIYNFVDDGCTLYKLSYAHLTWRLLLILATCVCKSFVITSTFFLRNLRRKVGLLRWHCCKSRTCLLSKPIMIDNWKCN